MTKSVELELALQKLLETKSRVEALRKAEKEAKVRRARGLREVKALMRKLNVSVSDMTDSKFA